jgi:lipid A 3-O-deacylase
MIVGLVSMRQNRFWKITVIGLALVCVSEACHAIDSTSVEFGTGNKTKIVRVGVQRDWNRRWTAYDRMHISGYWDLTLAYWRGSRYRGLLDSTQQIGDIGITPTFRLERENRTGPYAEAGLGVHFLSAHYDNNERKLSTNLQFATHLGIGYLFRNGIDFGLKIEHFSNGGIKTPNNGVNFAILRVAYPF